MKFDYTKKYYYTLLYYFIPVPIAIFALLGCGYFCYNLIKNDTLNWWLLGINVLIAILAIKNIVKFLRARYYKQLCLWSEASIEDKFPSTIFCGPPGTGKTSNMGQVASIISILKWKQVSYYHWYYSHPTIYKKMCTSKDTAFKYKIKRYLETYQFYAIDNPTYAPCAVSNVKMKLYGKDVLMINIDYIKQEIKLSICVVIYDEAGRDIGLKLSNVKNENINNMARLTRHFGVTLLWGEQRETAIAIDVRGVSVTKQYILQERIFAPKLLKRLVDKLTYKAVSKNIQSLNYRYRLDTLIKLENAIGFRKYTTRFLGDTNHGTGKEKDTSTFYTPSILNVEYDNTMFLEEYKAINLPLYIPKNGANSVNGMKFDDIDCYQYIIQIQEKLKKESNNERFIN